MLTEEIVWTPEYAVGVEIIDKAHQDLFRISRRLMLLSRDKSKYQWVGEEGLKFLKNYVVNHFEEEASYMRSIHYPRLEEHLKQHTLLREKILPRMEHQLNEENFSAEAIDKFLQIVQLWLCRHIMTHDTAITRVEQ